MGTGPITTRIQARKPEPKPQPPMPIWRRREQERIERIGYRVAVADLTERAA